MRSYAIAAATVVILVGIALYSSESSAGPAKVILKGAKKLLPKLAGRTIRIASAFGSRGIFRIPKVHRAFGYLKRTHPRVAKYLKISTGMFGGAGTAAGTQALIDYLDDEELMAEVQQIKTYAETVERQGEITQEEVEDLEGLIYGLSYALDEQKVLQIEGQVNDRPLHEESTDSFGVITPSLLVLGRKLRPWPDRFDKTDLQQHADLRERWKHRKAIVNQFWRTWSNRYLTSQQQRNKWQEDKPDVKEGELVLLEKEKMKRNQWPVARIQEVKMGRDNKIRSVILALPPRDADGKIKKGAPLLITRSIHNIFPLEATRDGEKIPPLQSSGQQL
ncbi:Hypothetical predicted protein [Paramuricea clavata]|uniref:DUF5641 domain-containing protein n=1 Tax=Paramuricea clavata TaxID=317549 RepID=A0A6S7K1E0_PARCT|nr:Hypothetical predicted protein [Paramuricea clavata]